MIKSTYPEFITTDIYLCTLSINILDTGILHFSNNADISMIRVVMVTYPWVLAS